MCLKTVPPILIFTFFPLFSLSPSHQHHNLLPSPTITHLNTSALELESIPVIGIEQSVTAFSAALSKIAF